MRALFTIQYLGTRYAGWQTQTNAVGIQTIIEEALSRVCQSPVRLEAAGRTDAGVHARGQRAHADIPISINERGLQIGLNDLLPEDIRIAGCEWVPAGFHARFDPSVKTYSYRIWNGPIADVFHLATCTHVRAPLDLDAMSRALEDIVGEHDFKSFTVAEPEVSSTIRTIESASVSGEGSRVNIEISAQGFLRFMVRRIAGSLIEIGRGKIAADSIAQALGPHFGPARWTAPAKGLVLEGIEYSAGKEPVAEDQEA